MELHPFHREAAVAQPHDLAVLGLRRHGEAGRQALALDDERVVPGGHEFIRNPRENPAAIVTDVRHLAVHHASRAHHLATESLSNRLVPQAHAEERHASGVPGPGESTTCDGPSAATSSTAIWSLRNTRTCAPSSPRYCARL